MFKQEFKTKALELHSKLMEDKRIEPFLLPVRKQAYPDYSKVVKHPTHMKMIKFHLQKNKDYGLAEFEEELNRMWENCCLYNEESSTIYQWARDLQRVTKEELMIMRKSLIQKIFESKGEKKKPELLELLRFGKFFMNLNSSKQERLMEAVEVINPRAIPRGLERIWLGRLTEDDIEGLIELQKL